MTALSFPWLTVLILLPVAAAFAASRADYQLARRIMLATAGAAILLALGAFADLGARPEARDPFDPSAILGGDPLFVLDDLSRLLLPFAAIVFFVVSFVRPRTEARPGAAVRALVAQATVFAIFGCRNDAALAVLWAVGMVPLHQALAGDGQRAALRGPRAYMAASVALFVLGVAARRAWPDPAQAKAIGTSLILAAVFIRKGIFPLHSWMPVLFERAPLPGALLYCAPQVGTYVAARLVLPEAPQAVLSVLGTLSLITAVYGAGLALVQKDGRRAFGWLFTSQSALTLAGLDCSSETGLVGGLSIWISSSAALTGLGMALCVLEARRGDVSLLRFHGGYENTPWLAASFALLGLCTVGFPGTLGFVGAELLIDGSVAAHAWVGFGVVLATVLNGIGVVRMYLVLFCGARTPVNPALRLKPREQIAFSALVALLVVGGVNPQPAVTALSKAAGRVLDSRAAGAGAGASGASGAPAVSAPEARPPGVH